MSACRDGRPALRAVPETPPPATVERVRAAILELVDEAPAGPAAATLRPALAGRLGLPVEGDLARRAEVALGLLIVCGWVDERDGRLVRGRAEDRRAG